MNYSDYQLKIFDFISNEEGHGVVNAVAGSGKTTTAVEMIKFFNSLLTGRFMAFNRHIADELSKRLPFPASTCNSFGWRIALSQLTPKPIFKQFKNQQLIPKEMFKYKNIVCRLVSLFKNMAFFTVEDAKANFESVTDRLGIDYPDKEEFFTLLWDVYERSINMTHIMDYDDQKFMPLKLGLDIPQSDYLIIDEYQDICEIENQLALGSCQHGRVIVFGDPDQCIYSFKGTTPGSMQNFDGTHLPLSICYRCPKNVVLEAKKIVPRIEYFDGNIDGVVDTISSADFHKMVGNGDLVLCRVTLYLVKSCLGFIRQGRKAFVQGREIGKNLISLVDQIGEDTDRISVFNFNLDQYFIKKSEYLTNLNKEMELSNLKDRVDSIKALMADCQNVKQLKSNIQDVFIDDGTGIKHMTIHKSKGLESGKDNNVFIIKPELIPHPKAIDLDEENRLKYVAITRARKGLFYVDEQKSSF